MLTISFLVSHKGALASSVDLDQTSLWGKQYSRVSFWDIYHRFHGQKFCFTTMLHYKTDDLRPQISLGQKIYM